MHAIKTVALVIVFLMASLTPLLHVEAGYEKRSDTDNGYIGQVWRSGLGTSVGSLNSIKSLDIDNDGNDELIFGNGQGFVHILKWNASANGFEEHFQTLDMGGQVKGIEVAQIDDDPQLEIAIGYNWVGDIGKVKIIDGLTLTTETNWTNGIAWSLTQDSVSTPYGLAMFDLDQDNQTELLMSGNEGHLWMVDADTPEKYQPWNEIKADETEWLMDVGNEIGEGKLENLWGLTLGQFDTDDAMEIALGSKQGWVAVFDGVTHELQWKIDMDGSSGSDSLCYSMFTANLNGNDIDELVIPQIDKFTVFIDGDKTTFAEDTSIKSGYGLASQDLGGNSNEELVVADSSGNIRILGLTGSSLNTYHQWFGGYYMNSDAGVTISMNGHDNPWIIHGGDAGTVTGWEIDAEDLDDIEHSLAWRTDALNNAGQNIYSLEGGNSFAVAMGELDSDDNLEMVVGSSSGGIHVYDGKTFASEWISDPLEKKPIGIAIGDLNNDGTNEIVVTTGNPDEPKSGGEGGEGYLYIFEKDGTGFEQVFKSDDINAALSVVISELDGTTYPEVAIATGYKHIIDPTAANCCELIGEVKIYGYDSSDEDWDSFDSVEWTSGELNEIQGKIVAGDLIPGGNNEIAVGTSGKFLAQTENNDPGQVVVYKRSGSTYVTDNDNIDTGRYHAYGLAIGDPDADGDLEIIVGTGEYGLEKPRILVYDGYSRNEEFSKKIESSSVWGIATDDIDEDGVSEIIYGTGSGQMKIFEMGEIEESSASGLSGKAGHYGGFAIGNADNEGKKEILVGSSAYMWLFTVGSQSNKPDLAISDIDIKYTPENPNEDDDIKISVTIYNYGGEAISKWRVDFTDGDPAGSHKPIDYYYSDEENESYTIQPGENFSFEITWYGTNTDPGEREVYAYAVDRSSPMRETRYSNNKAFTTISIEEIPNEVPVAAASVNKDTIWKGELVRINAGSSSDTEATNGLADDIDENADLDYSFYHDGILGNTINSYTIDIYFETSGQKQITVVVSDEPYNPTRGKENNIVLNITVKTNTRPEAILSSNMSEPIEIIENSFITFDVSESYDPDNRSSLEYRFDFGNGILSDWVTQGKSVLLYKNALITGSNGGELKEGSGEILTDEFGINRVFRLVNGELLGLKEGKLTEKGYNYSLPEGVEEENYKASIFAREISESGDIDDDILVSTRSNELSIKVYKPENIAPIARAQAGILIETVVVFNDLVDKAVTGDEVTYTAAESTDPDGDDTKLTFVWVIKDSQNKEVPLGEDKYARTFTRTWNEPGTYIATVTVTDERGGIDTWQVEVRVSKSVDYGIEVEEKEGYSPTTLIGGALASVLGLVGGAMVLSKLRGGAGEELDDMFDDVVPGPVELQCPSCGGLISITSAQRPIQIGCPICASQFVVRE